MAATVDLRDFRPDDASAVHRWFNDEKVTADLVGRREGFSLGDADGWVERAMDTSRDRKWAITIDGSDDAVGFVALFGLDRDVGPELAVLVGEPSAWGKGVARQAERQACVYAFNELGAHRIHAEIPATNEAAQKVVISLGFRQEGLLKQAIMRGDEAIDNQIWGLLPEDFTGADGEAEQPSRMVAELHADGGAAAASEDFFRSPAFCGAEGVTHTLEAGPALLPVIVREVPGSGGLADAISPYGYPGATVAEGSDPVDPAAVDWSGTGLVSVFVRDRIGGPRAFAGGTERSVVQVHDPARERNVRSRLAEQIRGNERAGWQVAVTRGPAAGSDARAAFHSLYTETMRRTGAAERYFFDAAYFDGLLAHDGCWLLTATAGRAPIGAGALAVLSDGLLHYYLGGTADAALDASPFKNVVATMMDLADELGVPLNLGGGVRPGDGLEGFKRGFANTELPFTTHEIVCDQEAYERLGAGHDAGEFFPAYRAP